MRIVSSLHEIGFSEESISRSPTPWFAGGRALRRVPIAADARMASEGMSFQLSCQLEVQNIQGLRTEVPCRFSGPCLPESGSRQGVSLVAKPSLLPSGIRTALLASSYASAPQAPTGHVSPVKAPPKRRGHAAPHLESSTTLHKP